MRGSPDAAVEPGAHELRSCRNTCPLANTCLLSGCPVPDDGRSSQRQANAGRRRNVVKLLRMLVLAAATAVSATVAGAQQLRTNINADPAMIDPITYSELDRRRHPEERLRGLHRHRRARRHQPDAGAALGGACRQSRLALPPAPERASSTPAAPFTARDVKSTFEALLVPGEPRRPRAAVSRAHRRRRRPPRRPRDRAVGRHSRRRPHARRPLHAAGRAVPDLSVHVLRQPPSCAERGAAGTRDGLGRHRPVQVRALAPRRRGRASTAHEAYWGGAPTIDGVRFMIVPSDDTAIYQYDGRRARPRRSLGTDVARRVLRDARLKRRMIAGRRGADHLSRHEPEPVRAVQGQARARGLLRRRSTATAMMRGLFGGLAVPLNGQITPGIAGYNPEPAADPPTIRERARRSCSPRPASRTARACRRSTSRRSRRNRLRVRLLSPTSFARCSASRSRSTSSSARTFLRSMNAGEIAFFPWGWTAGYPDAHLFPLADVAFAQPVQPRALLEPGLRPLIDQAQHHCRRRGALRALPPGRERPARRLGHLRSDDAHADRARAAERVRRRAHAVPLHAVQHGARSTEAAVTPRDETVRARRASAGVAGASSRSRSS